MNENHEIKNPLSTPEEHEKLVLGLKEDTQKALKEAKKWKDAFVKKEQELAESERQNRGLAENVEALKSENVRQRKIELNQKETKATNDFKTEYIKLQEQKGWKWSEERGWTR
jgi:hypothetical protein